MPAVFHKNWLLDPNPHFASVCISGGGHSITIASCSATTTRFYVAFPTDELELRWQINMLPLCLPYMT